MPVLDEDMKENIFRSVIIGDDKTDQTYANRRQRPFRSLVDSLFDYFGRRYGYEKLGDVTPLPEHYFDEGTVAFTDARRSIVTHEEERRPYCAWIFTRAHELEHWAIEALGLPHDDGAINRRVRSRYGLERTPFSSYAEPAY